MLQPHAQKAVFPHVKNVAFDLKYIRDLNLTLIKVAGLLFSCQFNMFKLEHQINGQIGQLKKLTRCPV